jgi:hypothetical protein
MRKQNVAKYLLSELRMFRICLRHADQNMPHKGCTGIALHTENTIMPRTAFFEGVPFSEQKLRMLRKSVL